MSNNTTPPRIAFIGGGNMAQALGLGLIGEQLAADDVLVIDPSEQARATWSAAGVRTLEKADEQLGAYDLWVLAVKPQQLEAVMQQCRPFRGDHTLALSIAAGIRATDIGRWLGTTEQPFDRVIRCMPNTPALVRQGVSGLMALPGVQPQERDFATRLFENVGTVVWVQDDAALDAVTALSGSGPAYVFLFLEALIAGGQKLGLSAQQARALALKTVSGAVQLAADSPEDIAQLRHNVTSEGGTTAAALAVFQQHDFESLVAQAMQAAAARAKELADQFSRS